MAGKRKTKPSGVITVLVMVFGAALLILMGNWLKNAQRPRVPAGATPGIERAGAPAEIQPGEREQLENILEEKGKR